MQFDTVDIKLYFQRSVMRQIHQIGSMARPFLLFNGGWWLVAFAAWKGWPWLSLAPMPILIAFHVWPMTHRVGELIFLSALAFVGFMVDSTFIKLGLFSIADGSTLSPAWLVCMWVLLGFTVASQTHLRSRAGTLILLGGLTGPLTYVWCEGLHLLHYSKPFWAVLLTHGVLWALMTPMIFEIRDFALKMERALTPQPQSAAEVAHLLSERMAQQSQRSELPPLGPHYPSAPADRYIDSAPPT